MKQHFVPVFVILAILCIAPGSQADSGPYEIRADLTPRTEIDKLVFARLKRLGIQPAHLCSDQVFLRRAYLDVIGTLPTVQEAKEFLLSTEQDKRRKLVDRLLEREEFADYWAMKWCDLLRVKAEFPINLWPNAVQAYHRWIRTSIKENLSYDRFVRELLTAGGSCFRVPQVNFYRAVQSREPSAIAQAVALTFMGARAENWPVDRLSGMAAFFAQVSYKSTTEWKEEIVFWNPQKARSGSGKDSFRRPVFPDGKPAVLPPDRDPREIFADWLIDAKNPWFARNIVNRIWFWLLGRGIIQEPDDIRADNPAQIPQLLAFLERELIASQYDLRHIYRLILDSKTYQLSFIPGTGRPEGAANFAWYPLRRLDAELLIDAICQITGTTEQYWSAIPEPYTFIPENQRAISLADGSITSSFLEMFGRSPRNTGLESERNNRITAEQELHLLNSSHIQVKIQQSGRLRSLLQSAGSPREQVNALYLTVLSRFPTDEELKVVDEYFRGVIGGRWEPVVDLVWALINSPEFLYRH